MSCAACVRRVEEGLKSIEGVKNASVNFATGKAVVEYDPAAASPDAMAEKVRDLGYEVVSREQAGPGAMQKTTVSIGGMTCAACVRRVEMALKDVPGVEEAAVNLATGRGTVTHGTDWAGAGGLRKAVTEAGYEYLGVLDATREDPIEKAREKETSGAYRQVYRRHHPERDHLHGNHAGVVPLPRLHPPPGNALSPLCPDDTRRLLGGQPLSHGGPEGAEAEDLRHEHAGVHGGSLGLSLLGAGHLFPGRLHPRGDGSPRLLRRGGFHRQLHRIGAAPGGADEGKDLPGDQAPHGAQAQNGARDPGWPAGGHPRRRGHEGR